MKRITSFLSISTLISIVSIVIAVLSFSVAFLAYRQAVIANQISLDSNRIAAESNLLAEKAVSIANESNDIARDANSIAELTVSSKIRIVRNEKRPAFVYGVPCSDPNSSTPYSMKVEVKDFVAVTNLGGRPASLISVQMAGLDLDSWAINPTQELYWYVIVSKTYTSANKQELPVDFSPGITRYIDLSASNWLKIDQTNFENDLKRIYSKLQKIKVIRWTFVFGDGTTVSIDVPVTMGMTVFNFDRKCDDF